jgi:hypothetical protein
MKTTNKGPAAGGTARGAKVSVSTTDADLIRSAAAGPSPAEADLRSRCPQAFNDLRRPLKLGIHAELGLTYPDPVLEQWISHPLYLRNTIAGGVRIGLDGAPASHITVDEQDFAYRRLIYLRYHLFEWDRRRRHSGPDFKLPAGLSAEEALDELRRRLPPPARGDEVEQPSVEVESRYAVDAELVDMWRMLAALDPADRAVVQLIFCDSKHGVFNVTLSGAWSEDRACRIGYCLSAAAGHCHSGINVRPVSDDKFGDHRREVHIDPGGAGGSP